MSLLEQDQWIFLYNMKMYGIGNSHQFFIHMMVATLLGD